MVVTLAPETLKKKNKRTAMKSASAMGRKLRAQFQTHQSGYQGECDVTWAEEYSRSKVQEASKKYDFDFEGETPFVFSSEHSSAPSSTFNGD
eukprot:CAMPEP_0174896614 /NCGR_PEP_ID=MMETSP0167-20121228/10763_1 /TAXON_ID=38298 /ORGANISM="Rhodella maculata, Strain CCMP736" /LENGTH=91 /DNA_ID=CAMNT_0016136219 /DNA_START=1 /DNA_END=276 /DNA_ORIENTATION=-